MRDRWEEIEEERIRDKRKERRRLQQEIALYIGVLKLIAIAMLILIGIATLNRLDAVMAGQNDLSVKIDHLSEEISEVNTLYQSEDKVALHGDLMGSTSPCMYLTTEQRDIVERIVASEARGEPYEGMMAVAEVIKTRSESWGQTIKEVCYAPYQFAKPYQGEVSEEVKQAVSAVFDNGEIVFGEVTHFHADWIAEPYWTEGKVSRGSIGSHRFYN